MSEQPMSGQALSGLLVVDLSQGVAGPYCTLMLRQQGARVIKVEQPQGDWSRGMGRARDGQTGLHLAVNAGKESVVLDSRTPHGQAALQALVARADVVVQAFRPGVAARMGVGHEAVAAVNPRVVYVSISGFGDTGPWSALPGLDTNVQAMSGLMHLNRDATGEPRKIGLLLLDLATAAYAANATLAALIRAGRTGRGSHVELSLLQVAAALQNYVVLEESMFAAQPPAPLNAPLGLYAAADGHLYVSTMDDAMFQRLATALGCTDWTEDEQLRTVAGRIPRSAELIARVASRIATEPVAHWEKVLTDHDVVHGRVRRPEELVTEPHAEHMGLFTTLDQPAVGPLPWAGLPGGGPFQPAPGPAPRLGEHTAAILAELELAGNGIGTG
jgi:CoA:oxalate CoA-transferase